MGQLWGRLQREIGKATSPGTSHEVCKSAVLPEPGRLWAVRR